MVKYIFIIYDFNSPYICWEGIDGDADGDGDNDNKH